MRSFIKTISYRAEHVIGTGSFGVVFQVITKPKQNYLKAKITCCLKMCSCFFFLNDDRLSA